MPYVLIQGGVVAQKQPNEQDFFIAAPDWVICGYAYANGVFTAPAATPPPVFTRVSRFTVVGRLSDAEGDLLLAAFNEAPGKLRFMWDSIQYIDHTDPNFSILHDFIASVLGVSRADEILTAVE